MIEALTDARCDERGVARLAARAALDGLRAECQALGSCLETAAPAHGHGGVWRGAASAMYRLRLLKLRARLSATLAAVDAAELALRVP